MFIRSGQSFYEMFTKNLVFPEYTTIRKFINVKCMKMIEGKLYFDELKTYLLENNFNLEVGIFEDGTKIVELVEYDLNNNILTGLVSPIDKNTGMPQIYFHTADSAININNSIINYNKSSYVQVILCQPNHSSAVPFILGFFGTDNRFNSKDVTLRMNYIFKSLANIGIRALCYGSDGDTRFLATQKALVNFGEFKDFGMIKLAGDVNSNYFGSQDAFHIAKKMKNTLFNPSSELRIGNKIATLAHIVIVMQKFDKVCHQLVPSDLDFNDKMNYK